MLERVFRGLASRVGYDLRRRVPAPPPPDLEPEFLSLFERCKPFTRTSVERMYSLHKATQHIVRAEVPGAFVECGVWRGGSAMIAAMTLVAEKATDRDLWLYDTYEGMSEPTSVDLDWRGRSASEMMSATDEKEMSVWCYSSLDEVRSNMARTQYPNAKMHFVKGKVEETIPKEAPEQIAILRLDTDFFESTYHELQHLFPRVSRGGILIVDDYGHWAGARKAVDKFFDEVGAKPLLHRIDYTGRIAVVQ